MILKILGRFLSWAIFSVCERKLSKLHIEGNKKKICRQQFKKKKKKKAISLNVPQIFVVDTYKSIFYVLYKVVTRAEGRAHTLILRDVKLTDAGEVSLTAKDFRTQANLFVKGKSVILIIL